MPLQPLPASATAGIATSNKCFHSNLTRSLLVYARDYGNTYFAGQEIAHFG